MSGRGQPRRAFKQLCETHPILIYHLSNVLLKSPIELPWESILQRYAARSYRAKTIQTLSSCLPCFFGFRSTHRSQRTPRRVCIVLSTVETFLSAVEDQEITFPHTNPHNRIPDLVLISTNVLVSLIKCAIFNVPFRFKRFKTHTL